MNKDRQRFEKWALSQGGSIHRYATEDQEYSDARTRGAWVGWQARGSSDRNEYGSRTGIEPSIDNHGLGSGLVEPFFATDEDYQKAINTLYREWRNRPSSEATTDFEEWKVRQVFIERARGPNRAMGFKAAKGRVLNKLEQCLTLSEFDEVTSEIRSMTDQGDENV